MIKIDQYSFLSCGSLTSIVIPKSVTEICTNAFHNCSALRSVSVPKSVQINKDAFDKNTMINIRNFELVLKRTISDQTTSATGASIKDISDTIPEQEKKTDASNQTCYKSNNNNTFEPLKSMLSKYPDIILTNPKWFISSLKDILSPKKSALFITLTINEPQKFNFILHDKNLISAEKWFTDLALDYYIKPEGFIPLFDELWKLYAESS